MSKAKRKSITVTIVNPEALGQASVNFTKALFKIFIKDGGMENAKGDN